MHKKAQDIYRIAREAHEEIYKLLVELTAVVPNNSNEENVDIVYAMREAEKFVDDTRKDINKLKKLAEQVVCLKWASMPHTSKTPKNIKTPYCTGTPEPKVCAHIPTVEKNPKEYGALMDYLAIDPMLRDIGPVISDLGKEETEVVKVNWPGFQSLINRLVANGCPLPDGIDPNETYTLYEVRCLKKLGVLDSPTA